MRQWNYQLALFRITLIGCFCDFLFRTWFHPNTWPLVLREFRDATATDFCRSIFVFFCELSTEAWSEMKTRPVRRGSGNPRGDFADWSARSFEYVALPFPPRFRAFFPFWGELWLENIRVIASNYHRYNLKEFLFNFLNGNLILEIVINYLLLLRTKSIVAQKLFPVLNWV